MEINSINIENIVKQVLNDMKSSETTFQSHGVNDGKSRAAILVAKEKFEIKEFSIPEISDDEILVKIEGCGVCGTDAHEYKNDPFNLIPLILGHEGSGTIVKLGKNVKKDSGNKDVKVGDKIVTSMIFGEDSSITVFDMNKQNISDNANVYGLLPIEDNSFNGWFAEHIIIKKNSSFFVVNDLNLDMRLLIEPSAVVVHAVERAKTTNILKFNSKVIVQGCGPIGLLTIAVIRTLGVENIIAIDGDSNRLNMAKKMGASSTLNFKDFKEDEMNKKILQLTDGNGSDFAFQCTGSPIGHSSIWKYIRRGGGLCELGFFVDNGNATINPHHDICKKEITVVGSWVYNLRDYPTTFDFLKRAQGIGIPLEELITHRFTLDQMDEALKTNISLQGIKVCYINDKF